MIRLPVLAAAIMIAAVPVIAEETSTRGVIALVASEKTHVFSVEIADEPAEQSRGLMYRAALPEGSGMLFVYPRPRHTSFWMKNTVIPLDMLFIDEDGRIVKIAAETTPLSLEPIPSGEPVVAVLEISGGAAERLGLEVGDRVQWVKRPEADADAPPDSG